MHQPQAAQTHLARAGAADVRQLELVGVADHDLLDLALAVEQHADLPVGLARQLGEVAGQLRADDLVRRDAAAVGVAQLVQLAGLEAEGVAVQVFQVRSPGQPEAAARGDLAISGPFRSWMQAASGGRGAGSRVTRPALPWWTGRSCGGSGWSSSWQRAPPALPGTCASKPGRPRRRRASTPARSRTSDRVSPGCGRSGSGHNGTGCSTSRRRRSRAGCPCW